MQSIKVVIKYFSHRQCLLMQKLFGDAWDKLENIFKTAQSAKRVSVLIIGATGSGKSKLIEEITRQFELSVLTIDGNHTLTSPKLTPAPVGRNRV
jgi:predicted GTPase